MKTRIQYTDSCHRLPIATLDMKNNSFGWKTSDNVFKNAYINKNCDIHCKVTLATMILQSQQLDIQFIFKQISTDTILRGILQNMKR
jgi:hypothetical protein